MSQNMMNEKKQQFILYTLYITVADFIIPTSRALSMILYMSRQRRRMQSSSLFYTGWFKWKSHILLNSFFFHLIYKYYVFKMCFLFYYKVTKKEC